MVTREILETRVAKLEASVKERLEKLQKDAAAREQEVADCNAEIGRLAEAKELLTQIAADVVAGE